ncbi:MAG: hypothetical protein V4567_08145 [Pseudomonadota bacterium]
MVAATGRADSVSGAGTASSAAAALMAAPLAGIGSASVVSCILTCL